MGRELKPVGPTEEIVRRIAMDVGKQVVHHIETMYPAMTETVSWKSARLSIRNATHNAIMAAVNAADIGRAEQAIEANEKHRRFVNRMKKAKTMEDVFALMRDNNCGG